MQKIRIISLLIILFSVEMLRSQTVSNADDHKLWTDSFEKAKLIAIKNKLSILLFFTASDTCNNCIKMRKNILDSKEFIEYSRNTFIMLQIDHSKNSKTKLLPLQIKKNKELAKKYNPEGKLPQIVVLDAKGGVKASANYLDIPVSEYLPQFKALLNMFK